MSGWCWVVKQVAWQPGYGASAHEPDATSSTSEEHSLAQDRPCVVLYAWTRVSDLSARTWHPMSLNHADWPRRRHGERVPRCTPGLNHRRVAARTAKRCEETRGSSNRRVSAIRFERSVDKRRGRGTSVSRSEGSESFRNGHGYTARLDGKSRAGFIMVDERGSLGLQWLRLMPRLRRVPRLE